MPESDRREKERDLWLLLLLLLMDQTRAHLRALCGRLFDGEILPLRFGQLALVALISAHGHAAYLGRQKAGDIAPFDQADRAFGELAADRQSVYLAGFVQDLQGSRYRDDEGDWTRRSVLARAAIYAGALAGTANRAWGMTLPPETQLWWHLEPEAEHCSDCPELERNGPYTPATIPTWPAEGDTRCLHNCKCWVEAESGETSFRLDLEDPRR